MIRRCIHCNRPLPASGIMWHWIYEDGMFEVLADERRQDFADWLVSNGQ